MSEGGIVYCRCGTEFDLSVGYCAVCRTRRPFAWTCERCSHEVPWDHPTNLVCSTVCPTCGDAKPASLPSPVIIRPTAVIPNCSPVAQFVLLVGAVVSFLGCVWAVIVGVLCLVNGQWLHAFVTCPFLFLLLAAVFVVFIRVRELGRQP